MPTLRTRPRPAAPPSGPTAGASPIVQSSRRRFLQRIRARRWRLAKRIGLLALAVAVVVTGIWLVLFSSAMSVKGTKVEGVSVLTAAEVRQVAEVPTAVPVATVDLDAIQARVEQLAPVRSAEVSRSWPDAVSIAVTERVAVVAVDREGTWRGVDGQGVVFRDYPKRPPGLPVARMTANTSVEALAEAAAVVDSLPADLLRRVQRLEVGSIDRIVLHLRSGARVNWGSSDQSDDKGRVLQVLLKQKGTAYDVTAPGRPTVRP